MENTKTCTKCRELKPATLEFFHKDLEKKSGFKSQCIQCRKKYYEDNCENLKQKSKHHRENNREYYLQKQKEYYWANPEKFIQRSTKWQQENPEKVAQLYMEWVQNNPEKRREYKRKSGRKRRALKLQNEHSPYTEEEVLNLYGTDCHLCCQPIDLEAPRRTGLPRWEFGLHMDHVLPISKGGSDTLENVKPAHGKCNINKGSKIPN